MACHCNKNRQAARRVTAFECKNRRGARRVVSTGLAACGWLRGTSRTSPGPPRRWQRPVRLRSTSARGRGFAAYLSACGGQPFNVRCAHYARGASLSTFGFVTIVPRYLLPQVIPSHSFAALTALIVRRVNGHGDQPMLTCASRRTPPRRGIGVRTRQRHLAAARAKKNLKLCAKQLEVKKFPAPCYSPIVKCTVPSPLESLTTVFGKGTCVSAPL